MSSRYGSQALIDRLFGGLGAVVTSMAGFVQQKSVVTSMAGFDESESVVTFMAGSGGSESVVTSMAGFADCRRPHPGSRTTIPAAFR